MTAFDAPERLPRFERDLREALREEAGLARPDYLSDALLRTVEARQRPAWTFPERWIPMSVVSSRAVPTPRIPWRILAVAAILVAVAIATLLVAGSRRHAPAPFGPAANGLVAYAKNGVIYTADPVTGKATALMTGTAQDSDPVWSRDGTMLAFVHQTDAGPGQLMVAAADGSGLRPITQTLPGIGVHDFKDSRHVNLAFSPDGREVAFTSGNAPMKTLWVADVRQGVARELNWGRISTPAANPRGCRLPVTRSCSMACSAASPGCTRSTFIRARSVRSSSRPPGSARTSPPCHRTARGSPTRKSTVRLRTGTPTRSIS